MLRTVLTIKLLFFREGGDPTSSQFPHLHDRYRITQILGEGGMGTVYRAYDLLLNRYVALKVLKSNLISIESHKFFVKEARFLANLNHPGVIPIYD